MNLPEQEYHDYPAWSQSIIAKYARNGFSALPTLLDKVDPTPEMKFGSLVDCIITRGVSVAKNEYTVSDAPLPSPSVKAVLDYILLKTGVPYTEIQDDVFLEAMDSCKYQPKWKYETRRKSIDDCFGYYELRRAGKEVISEQDWNDAMDMAKAIRTDPYLKNVFGVGKKDGIEYLYQVQFVTSVVLNLEETQCKCMFDLLVVDHNKKTLQPVDLKTSSMPAYSFADHFVKMRYDLQASLYTYILKDVIKDTEYSNYTVLPYLFTDISRTDKVPVTFEYDPSGGFSFKDYTYKDWPVLLEEIISYKNTNATVPSYIRTDGPNDLIKLLNKEYVRTETE